MSESQRNTPPDELRRSRDQLDVILRGVAEAITALEPGGRVVYANPAALKMFGFETKEQLIGLSAEQATGRFAILDAAGAPVAADRRPSYSAMSGESPPPTLHRWRSLTSGEERWVQVTSAPVFDEAGQVLVVINIYRDVTETKIADDALRVSHEWFATTLKSIGDAVIATDARGHVTFMNQVAEELTGWTLDQARGLPLRDVFEIVNEKTREEVESPVTKVLREGVVVGLANHTILIQRDKGEIAIDDSGAPIRNSEGKLVGVVLVFRDVTEKRREEERRLFIAEASAVLASSLDYATTLSTVARLAVPQIADWCTVDVLEEGDTIRPVAFAHVDPEKVKWVHELQRRFPRGGDGSSGVAGVLRTGKPELYFDYTEAHLRAAVVDEDHREVLERLGCKSQMILPLRARGRTLGVISLCTSASNRRFTPDDVPLAEQLASAAALAVDNARLYAEAQEASRLKDEFLATLSHELRTPLNAMLGWTRMLRSGMLDEGRRDRALATIERNAQAQARLIDDLLDVSRIITGKLRLDIRSTEVAGVVEAALDANRPAADAKGIRVDVRIDRMTGPISADPGRLQQVVWNLLSNAVKFTPRGGRVWVEVGRTGSFVEIKVGDNGQGIESAFLPYVFDRFRQADATVTKTHTGLGLGLSIVRHLVELHGGRVRADSEGNGRGSLFTVTLPVAAVHRVQEVSEPGSVTIRLPDLSGLTVLVVEDDDDNRELVTTVLEEAGASTVATGSVEEAFSALTKKLPDVVLSDIGMPHDDGYELIRRLRALPPERGGKIPAAALTAHAGADNRANVLLGGFQAYVPKPVDPAELAAVVASLVGRTRGTAS